MEQGRLSVLQKNKYPILLIEKRNNKNMILNFVLCQVRLILFNTNLITKNNISYMKTVLNTLKITANFVKSRYKRKNILASLARIFSRWSTF